MLGALPWVIREEMPLQGKPELPWQDFKHPKLEKLIKIYKNGGLLRFLTRFISLIFIVKICVMLLNKLFFFNSFFHLYLVSGANW